MTETATPFIERLMDDCPRCGRAIPPGCEGVAWTRGDATLWAIGHAFWCMGCEVFWIVEQRSGRAEGFLVGPTAFRPPRQANDSETVRAHDRVFGSRGRTAPRE